MNNINRAVIFFVLGIIALIGGITLFLIGINGVIVSVVSVPLFIFALYSYQLGKKGET